MYRASSTRRAPTQVSRKSPRTTSLLSARQTRRKRQKLIAALNECVESIDDVLPFFASDKAKELFGEEQAAAMLKKAQEVKAAGGDTCFCPACTNGKFVLDHQDLLLK